MLGRTTALLYGTLVYAAFLVVFLYAIGFIGGFLTPTSLDGPLEGSLAMALVVNVGLLGLFAVQHSLMARPWFKRWWTRVIPQPIERSTYVLFTNLALLAVFAYWRPLGGVVWNVENSVGRTALYGLYAMGWLIVLGSTILINHFDLFGLRQVWLYFRGKPCLPLTFATPGPYRWVRHPLYVGWLIVFWATPSMTTGHLAFALITSAYVLVAVRWEERDLVNHFGARYEAYRRQVPMFIPWPRFGRRAGADAQASVIGYRTPG